MSQVQKQHDHVYRPSQPALATWKSHINTAVLHMDANLHGTVCGHEFTKAEQCSILTVAVVELQSVVFLHAVWLQCCGFSSKADDIPHDGFSMMACVSCQLTARVHRLLWRSLFSDYILVICPLLFLVWSVVLGFINISIVFLTPKLPCLDNSTISS